MANTVFLGRKGQLQKVSEAMWKQHLAQIPEQGPNRLSFMTESHHRIRNFVVLELALRQQPIEPKLIAERLDFPLSLVNVILDELEQRLFFLVRNAQGAVSWAYPVTIETTPHRLTFKSGEQLYAA
jgi:hypothetical protein